MTYDEIKKWLEDNNYQNSGLRTDRNHRIDLYLSDVLHDFAQQQVKNLNIPDVVVPKGTRCPDCGEDKSIEDWQTYYRCKMCDTKF